jgi:hypothetical protein
MSEILKLKTEFCWEGSSTNLCEDLSLPLYGRTEEIHGKSQVRWLMVGITGSAFPSRNIWVTSLSI